MTSRTKLIFTLAILALAVMILACAAVPYGARSNAEIMREIEELASATETAEALR